MHPKPSSDATKPCEPKDFDFIFIVLKNKKGEVKLLPRHALTTKKELCFITQALR
jgi:hypothetical protein